MTEHTLVTKLSPRSVADTVQRLRQIAESKGLEVFAVIDHDGAAKANGLELRETRVVLFGSPQAGTPIMQALPTVALDLPLKVLVWDDDGQTTLTYTSPGELARRWDLDDEQAARLAGIDPLMDAVVG